MTIIPFPTRAARRYGGPVVTEAMSFEDEQDDGVQALAARLVAALRTCHEGGIARSAPPRRQPRIPVSER